MFPVKPPSRPVATPSRRLTSRVPAHGDVWVYWQCREQEDVSRVRVRDMSMGGLFHRDTPAKDRRHPDQVAFPCARRTDQGRRGGAACQVRRWVRIEIYGLERARPAKAGCFADQASRDASFAREIVIQSSGVMISAASFEPRTGINSKSTRSRQWPAHCSSKCTSPHSINWKQRSKFVSTQLCT